MDEHDDTGADASSEKDHGSAAEALGRPRAMGKSGAVRVSARARRAATAARSNHDTPAGGDATGSPHHAKAGPARIDPAKIDPAKVDEADVDKADVLEADVDASTTAMGNGALGGAAAAQARPSPAAASSSSPPSDPPAADVAGPAEPATAEHDTLAGATASPAPPAAADTAVPDAAPTTFIKTAAKTVPALDYDLTQLVSSFILKDNIMDMTSNYTAGIKDAMSEAQGKAKDALSKSSQMMGEVSDFTRANVEACVETGKILAAGLQDLGTSMVAEGRSAFEEMTADLKGLAAAKSPAEFLRLQGELMRKSLDSAVSNTSKNSEAMMKLAGQAIAPISGRVSVAVEKVRTAA